MAYIQPNSTVKICKGVPLDEGYEHTVLFTNRDTQVAGFASYIKYNLSNNQGADFSGITYQRVKEGVMRVNILADNLYDCNYLLFQNTNFGTKWFYAFINKVTYVNNATSEIEYTLDLMQSFLFDYTIPPCFIEREHALTDVIGDNLVPENVNTGVMTLADDWEIKFEAFYTCIKYVPNTRYIESLFYNHDTQNVDFIEKNKSANEWGIYQYNMYNGYVRLTIPKYTVDTDPIREYTAEETWKMLTSTINKIIDLGGTIIDIVYVPSLIIADADWKDSHGDIILHDNPFKITLYHTETRKFYDEAHIAYYEPKNMKMFTAPFKKIIVSNNAGQSGEFEFEKFRDFGDSTQGEDPDMKKTEFALSGIVDPDVEASLYPQHYRGFENGDLESGLLFNNFYHGTWDVDSFRQWWQLNKQAYITSLGTTVLSTAVTTLANIGMENYWGAAVTGVNGICRVGNSLMELQTQANKPHQLAGESSSTTIQFWQHRSGFHLYEMGVEYDLAISIDDFFTKFGYAQNKLKVPEIKNPNRTLPLRPYWNYIKTSDCVIKPIIESPITGHQGLSSEDKRRIESIYNSGITFWNNLANVGNYSLDNSIVS